MQTYQLKCIRIKELGARVAELEAHAEALVGSAQQHRSIAAR